MSSLKPTSDRKVGKKSICSAISNKNRLKSSSSKTSLRKAEMTKDIKKVEMISSSKAITCNLLYKIIKLKNITINERNILSKFCQLINECRLDESHESKSYKSVKSQQMFIERSIYFLDNKKLSVDKLINLLFDDISVLIDSSGICKEIECIQKFLKCTFEYLSFIQNANKTNQNYSSSVSKCSESCSIERSQNTIKDHPKREIEKPKAFISICDESETIPQIHVSEASPKISEISISKIYLLKDSRFEGKEEKKKKISCKTIKINSKDKSNIHKPPGYQAKIQRVGKKISIDFLKTEDKFIYNSIRRSNWWNKEKDIDGIECNHNEPNNTKNKKIPMEIKEEVCDQKIKEKLRPQEIKEFFTLSPSDENLSLEQKDTNMLTIENENVSKELVFDRDEIALCDKKSLSESSRRISLSDFEQDANDSEIEIDIVSKESDSKQFDIKEYETPKFPTIPKILKQSLSTIEEHHSMDESCEDGTKTDYYDSVYSCEPFDLENSMQEQLSVGEFKLKIENGSLIEENESLLKNEILIDDMLCDI